MAAYILVLANHAFTQPNADGAFTFPALPPGHYVLYQQGQLTVAPYWVPEFNPPSGRASFPALKDEFRSLLHNAVKRQLDGSKAACFLSGGTDSSTVAGLIAELGTRPAATYSIGFEGNSDFTTLQNRQRKRAVSSFARE